MAESKQTLSSAVDKTGTVYSRKRFSNGKYCSFLLLLTSTLCAKNWKKLHNATFWLIERILRDFDKKGSYLIVSSSRFARMCTQHFFSIFVPF